PFWWRMEHMHRALCRSRPVSATVYHQPFRSDTAMEQVQQDSASVAVVSSSRYAVGELPPIVQIIQLDPLDRFMAKLRDRPNGSGHAKASRRSSSAGTGLDAFKSIHGTQDDKDGDAAAAVGRHGRSKGGVGRGSRRNVALSTQALVAVHSGTSGNGSNGHSSDNTNATSTLQRASMAAASSVPFGLKRQQSSSTAAGTAASVPHRATVNFGPVTVAEVEADSSDGLLPTEWEYQIYKGGAKMVEASDSSSDTPSKAAEEEAAAKVVPTGNPLFDAIGGLTQKYFHKSMPAVELRQLERYYRQMYGKIDADQMDVEAKRGKTVRRVIHNHFLGDFWEVYREQTGKQRGKLVNGFEPKTWERLENADTHGGMDRVRLMTRQGSEARGDQFGRLGASGFRSKILGQGKAARFNGIGTLRIGPVASSNPNDLDWRIGSLHSASGVALANSSGTAAGHQKSGSRSVPAVGVATGAQAAAGALQKPRQAAASKTRTHVDPLGVGSDEVIARVMLTMTLDHPSQARDFIREWESKNTASNASGDKGKALADQAIEYLRRAPTAAGSRPPHELAVIEEFLRPMAAFKRMADFVFSEMCRLLVAETYKAGEYVFKQGDIGSRWYVLVSGRVQIMINKPGYTSADEDPERSIAATLSPGEGFGDHALVNDVPRVASAIADCTPTTIVRLEKTDFRRLMGLVHTLEQKELVYYLRKIPLLKNLDLRGLRNIADRMTMRELPPGSVIIREGECKESVYFVRRGLCAVFRTVRLPQPEWVVMLGSLCCDRIDGVQMD
ncbi:hypothetical protein BC831DRAFT_481032, partial [Entophlyctis helioformis]